MIPITVSSQLAWCGLRNGKTERKCNQTQGSGVPKAYQVTGSSIHNMMQPAPHTHICIYIVTQIITARERFSEERYLQLYIRKRRMIGSRFVHGEGEIQLLFQILAQATFRLAIEHQYPLSSLLLLRECSCSRARDGVLLADTNTTTDPSDGEQSGG